MPYALLASPGAQRQLDALPKKVANGIREVLQLLASDPHDPRFRLKALKGIPQGRAPILRLRIGGYRILLRIDDAAKEILVARIGDRRSVYRGLEHLDP